MPSVAEKTIRIAVKFLNKIRYKRYVFNNTQEAKRDIEKYFATLKTSKNKYDSFTMFDNVEIDIINRCNGTCSFCPVNKHIDPRPLARMSDDIFHKIIDNLAKLNYGGLLEYFSNNEPLLDNRIYDFIKYGVSRVPNAYHVLYTNGILLDSGKFQALAESGLNYLRIDNYNDDMELNPNIQKIYDEYKDKEFGLVCEIYIRLNNEVLSNRGGSAPNKQKFKKPLDAPCFLPFRDFIIRADCGVSLCCNDALGKVTLGNVKEQTIEEIWYGQKRLDIIESMRKNLRKGIEICEGCDAFSTDKSFVRYKNSLKNAGK